jgi:DNA-binding NtrC family response regulator
MANTSTLSPPDPGRTLAGALELVGQSSAVGRVREIVRRAAALDGGALIAAEDGCDVESVVRELHARGRYAGGALITVDCAEAETVRLDRSLFGLPAVEEASDLEPVTIDSAVNAARGGILFLHRVAELPAAAQSRLARIARDGEVRVNGVPVETGFRLVASASSAIDADVDTRRFRADLYRRLSAVRIDLPPLRERQDDVPALAERVLVTVCAARGIAPRAFTQAALALVGAWNWPGNLRELTAVIDRVAGESADTVIQIEDLLPALRVPRRTEPFAPSGSLREARLRFERDYIAGVLQHHGWRMADAARTLGIQRPNLYRKARQLGIPLTRVED